MVSASSRLSLPMNSFAAPAPVNCRGTCCKPGWWLRRPPFNRCAASSATGLVCRPLVTTKKHVFKTQKHVLKTRSVFFGVKLRSVSVIYSRSLL